MQHIKLFEEYTEGGSDELLDLIKDYINWSIGLDQGSALVSKAAEKRLPIIEKKIISIKDKDYFDAVSAITDLLIYDDSSANKAESKDIENKLKPLLKKIGYTRADIED